MRFGALIGLACAVQLSFAVLANANTAKEKWACLKDQKALAVKGASDKAKQAACKKQGGMWQKEVEAPAAAEPAPAPEHVEQNSGGGGGW